MKTKTEKAAVWILAAHVVVLFIQTLSPSGRIVSFLEVGSSSIGVLAAFVLARRGYEQIAALGLVGVLGADIHASIMINALSEVITGRGGPVNIFLMICSLGIVILTGILLDKVWLLRKILTTNFIILFVHIKAMHTFDAPEYLLWGSIIYLVICLTIYGIFLMVTRKHIIGRIKRFRRSKGKTRFTLEKDDGTIIRGQIVDPANFSINDRIIIDRYIQRGDEIEAISFRILRHAA